MIVLVIAVGAALGAPTRYLTDRAMQRRSANGTPWGTFLVNIVASLVLGIVTGAAGHLSATVAALIGTGFCATLSTFSTFSYETVVLARRGMTRVAGAYVGLSVVVGLAAAAAGWALGSA